MKKVLLILLIGLGFNLHSQNVPNYIPQDSLWGWYPFTGNLIDSSGNGNDGRNTTCILTPDKHGNLNSAYKVDGVSCLGPNGIILPISIDGTHDYSVSLWFLENNVNATTQCLWNTFPHNISGNTLNHVSGINKQIKTYYGTQSSGWYSTLSGSIVIPNSTVWNNLIITKSSTEVSYYLNGSLSQIKSLPTTINTGQIDSLVMGAINHNGGVNCYEAFNGKIDNIGVWGRVLDSCEIKNVYKEQYLQDSIISTATYIKIDSNTTKSILSIDSIHSTIIDTVTTFIDTIQDLGIKITTVIDTINYNNILGSNINIQIDTLVVNSNISHIITERCTSEYFKNTSYVLKDSTYLNQNIQWTHTYDSISNILNYYLDTTSILTFTKTDSIFTDSLLYNSCLDTTFLISDTITSLFVKKDTNNSLSPWYSSLSYYINNNTVTDTLTQSYNRIDTLHTIITYDTIIKCNIDTVTQDSSPYWFPNVFTPNGDNINDLYEFHTPDEEFIFTVYNRWGNRVWEQTTIDNNWNGYNRGEIASAVYFYTYQKTSSSGYKGMPFQGTITLLR